MEKIKTSDLFCGAYLLSSGAKLSRILQDPGKFGRLSFEFEDEKILNLTHDYLAGQAQVNVLEFKASLKHLKDILQKKTHGELLTA